MRQVTPQRCTVARSLMLLRILVLQPAWQPACPGTAEVVTTPGPPLSKSTAVCIEGLVHKVAVLSLCTPKFPSTRVQEAASSPHMAACMGLEHCCVRCSSAQAATSITMPAICTFGASVASAGRQRSMQAQKKAAWS